MTSEQNTIRKLAAILFADIVGYTALMQKGESMALAILARYEEITINQVAKFNGEIVKTYGDGSLILFDSLVDAVTCAQNMQLAFQKTPIVPLRIGIHVGEVVRKGNDIFGNVVNIASRVESIGVAGSVLLTKDANQRIKNQEVITTQLLGSFDFKNVDEPIEVYALVHEGLCVPDQLELPVKGKSIKPSFLSSSNSTLILLGVSMITIALLIYFQFLKPDHGDVIQLPAAKVQAINATEQSIAVLPFRNMSGQDDLEYVVDGMTDAIISRLTRISDIDKVSSFTSISKYKNTNLSISEIAEELGVKYLVQGNFQKSGSKFKIRLQLILGNTDDQLWDHEYSGEWNPNEIFGMQAEVTETVAGMMNSSISATEIAAIQKMPTSNTEAYNLFLRAEFQRKKNNQSAYSIAIPLYEQTIELDSNFCDAYIGLAYIWTTGGLVWGIYEEKEAWQNSRALLVKALEIDSSRLESFLQLEAGTFYYDWDFTTSEKYLAKRRRTNTYYENDMDIDYLVKTSRYEEALELVKMKLEIDPSRPIIYAFHAEVLYFLSRPQEAIDLLKSSDLSFNDNMWYLREAAKLSYYLGEYESFYQRLDQLLTKFADRSPIHYWFQAIASHLKGNTSEAAKHISQINKKYEEGSSGSPAWFMALYYFHTGDQENGFKWLQRSYDRHEVEMTWLQEEPLLAKVKNDPRYQSIYSKMGFPILLKE